MEDLYNNEELKLRAKVRTYNFCSKRHIRRTSQEYKRYYDKFLGEIVENEKAAIEKRKEEEKLRKKECLEQKGKAIANKLKEATKKVVHGIIGDVKAVALPSAPSVSDAKEELIDIVDAVDSSLHIRKKYHLEVYARVHCTLDGDKDTLWLMPNLLITDALGDKELNALGRFVPQYSPVAIQMQCNDVGACFEYDQKNLIKKVIKHYATIENRSDFQNHTIAIAGDKYVYQYRNIHEFLETLRENSEQIESVRAEIKRIQQRIEELKAQGSITAGERRKLTIDLNKLEEEYRILTQQQEDLKNITIYIHRQGELRYKHVIDTIQTRIMSQNLFDGKTIIIDGGPGTGKTTTMIHRLSYLTNSYAIQKDEELHVNNFKLSHQQRVQLKELVDNQRDWMFFSPSLLLKDYLADAMNKEGLTNTSMKVWYWKEYCQLILQTNYHLLESSEDAAPFKASHNTDTLFYQGSGIINELTNYLVGQLRLINSLLPEIKVDGPIYVWTSIAKGIKERFSVSEDYDLAHFVTLFISLNRVYGDVCKDLLRNNRISIQELVDEICDLLENNRDTKYELEDLLDITIDEQTEAGEDDETEDEGADELHHAIALWLKPYSYSTVDPDVRLKGSQKMMSELLLPLLGSAYDDRIQRIGQLVMFEQFAKYTTGVTSALFSGFAAMYKRFRKYILKQKLEGCNLPLLRELIQNHGGRDLHLQEQSLLVGFINTIVKLIKSSGKWDIKHTYIDAFDEIARPIIGIDEATDFSECDIYAMQSLMSPGFNSLTLCGDMMQRLTASGITSWDEIKDIVPNPVVVEMKTSYRQSTKVLDVARQLYIDTIGTAPGYKAYMKSKRVPEPLVCVARNEFAKTYWIGKRIEEVYRAYGQQLPSIAIFVNDKGYIPRFMEMLGKTDFFASNNIKVIDGTNSSLNITGNHICVYPIEVVKGMEFDVVFFHNIDNSHLDTEFLKRFIYVGVSRASFFLGITLSEWNEDLCKYFKTDKDWFKI